MTEGAAASIMSRKKKRTKKEHTFTKQEPGTSTKPTDAGHAGQIPGPDDDPQIIKDVANLLAGKWIKLSYLEWCSMLRIVHNPSVHQLTEHTVSRLRGIKKLEYTLYILSVRAFSSAAKA